MYSFYKEKQFDWFDKKLFKIFLFFWIYISILSLFADELYISLKSSFFYIRFALYTISILYFLKSYDQFLTIVYPIYKYTLIFVLLDSIFQVFYGSDFFGLKPDSLDLMRISGPFGSKHVLGSFLQKILPVYIYLTLKIFETHKKIKIIDLIIITLSFVLIYRSGDRSALGLIFLFSFIFFLINKTLRFKMIKILIFAILISLVFTIQNPKTFERNFSDTINQFKGKYYEDFLIEDISETNLKFMIFSFHHQTHFSTAYRMFLDKPIFGHGVKMFRYKCQKFSYQPQIEITDSFGNVKRGYGCSTHPHNTYFQFLAETGLVGFLFIFSLFLFLGYKIISLIKNNKTFYPETALIIGIFINIWPFIPTGNFFNNWLSIIYFIPITFYLYEINNKKKLKKN
tara:strand:- start:4451 stop:5647 length:1197 start_codon:yes stop_codon:yes gene_type:complete